MQYSAFTVLGDLNSDGFDDLAVRDNQSRHGYSADPSVSFISGATGAYLANWSHTFEFFGRELVGVGDVDGDGFGDLLLGDSFAKPIGGNADGGWQLVSGRILATTYQIPVQCHGGPFPPDLGMSRPIIGQSAVLVGRDGPANAWGVLALSPRPEFPVSLGFSGCYAWFDTSNWIVAHLAAPAAQWTFSLPLPNVPQLAGVDVALQSFYVPSNSPIGLDLSNAIWARIGF
jgi:hypothetical protein